METEIEAKFLEVDPQKIRTKLQASGGKLVKPEQLMKRKIFDYPDKRLFKEQKWIRLRDEGDKVTLTYKHRTEISAHGTKEVEVIVSDFDKTEQFLKAIGFESYIYFETKREEWELDGTMVTIDSWPWIPTFSEIEAKDEKTLKKVAAQLDLAYSKAMFGSAELVYVHYYNVDAAEANSWKEVTFSPIPEWLQKKRRAGV